MDTLEKEETMTERDLEYLKSEIYGTKVKPNLLIYLLLVKIS